MRRLLPILVLVICTPASTSAPLCAQTTNQTANQTANQTTNQSIPNVHSPALTGEIIDLPAALKGKVGVLVLGFSQGSRDEVTVWGRRLASDFMNSNTVVYYEMPVLASVPRFLRGLVLRKVKDAVPERAQSRFLPILDHEAEWKTLAGFKAPDDAYVLIVSAGGILQWTLQGKATDLSYAEVKQRIESLRPFTR